MQIGIDESKLKQVFKEAFIEILEERNNMFHDMIVDAIEDIALSRAIHEGNSTEIISKQEVFDILEGQA